MIIHVITDFYAPHGAQKMLARLLKQQSSMPAIVVSLTDVSDANRQAASNPLVRYEAYNVASVASIASSVIRLRKLIRNERPAVVLCWMYHAMAVGTLATKLAGTGTPVFWNVRQSLDDPASLTRNTRQAVAVCKLLSSFPTGTIYNSQRALKLHGERGFRNHNAIVIPNGFEVSEGVVARATRPTTFGFAARYHAQKDPSNFIQAAAQAAQKNPQLRFVMAGKDNTKDNRELMSMISDSGLSPDKIDLLGELDDMDRYYERIDALVLSSRTEGFPNVVAEAMSHAKPVITTNVGDAAQVVGDAGLVVPPRDPDTLAAAIEDVSSLSGKQYSELAQRAYDRVRSHYSLSSVDKQYQDYLDIPIRNPA